MPRDTLARDIWVITRFGEDPPRLFAVTSENTRAGQITGRDVETGRLCLLRARDVLARHGDICEAYNAFERVRDACAAEDASVAQARRLLAKACRRRAAEITRIAASGSAP